MKDYLIVGTDHGVFIHTVVKAESAVDASKNAGIQAVYSCTPC